MESREHSHHEVDDKERDRASDKGEGVVGHAKISNPT
jgi:hypothetical protein